MTAAPLESLPPDVVCVSDAALARPSSVSLALSQMLADSKFHRTHFGKSRPSEDRPTRCMRYVSGGGGGGGQPAQPLTDGAGDLACDLADVEPPPTLRRPSPREQAATGSYSRPPRPDTSGAALARLRSLGRRLSCDGLESPQEAREATGGRRRRSCPDAAIAASGGVETPAAAVDVVGRRPFGRSRTSSLPESIGSGTTRPLLHSGSGRLAGAASVGGASARPLLRSGSARSLSGERLCWGDVPPATAAAGRPSSAMARRRRVPGLGRYSGEDKTVPTIRARSSSFSNSLPAANAKSEGESFQGPPSDR